MKVTLTTPGVSCRPPSAEQGQQRPSANAQDPKEKGTEPESSQGLRGQAGPSRARRPTGTDGPRVPSSRRPVNDQSPDPCWGAISLRAEVSFSSVGAPLHVNQDPMKGCVRVCVCVYARSRGRGVCQDKNPGLEEGTLHTHSTVIHTHTHHTHTHHTYSYTPYTHTTLAHIPHNTHTHTHMPHSNVSHRHAHTRTELL